MLTIEVKKHAPNRYYYKARNHVIMMCEYFFKEPVWILKSLYGVIKSIFLVCLFEQEKLLKLKLTIIGYIHGIIKYSVRDF